MPIHLTLLDPAATGLPALDAAAPDGPAKEVLARGAALGLLRGLHDGGYLAETHALLAPVAAAAAGNPGAVNAVVARLVFLDAVRVPPGGSEADAVAAVASMVADVWACHVLAVATLPPPPAGPKSATAAGLFGPAPDAAGGEGLDLGGPAFAALRYVWTRTLTAARPAAFAEYRRLKRAGTPAAKRTAYGYAFGLLKDAIAAAEKRYAHD
jgi:hypothetical protein